MSSYFASGKSLRSHPSYVNLPWLQYCISPPTRLGVRAPGSDTFGNVGAEVQRPNKGWKSSKKINVRVVFLRFLWSPSTLALKVNILEDKQLQFKVNENTKKCSSLSDNFSLFIKKIVLSLFISLLRLIIYHLNYTRGIFFMNSKQTER